MYTVSAPVLSLFRILYFSFIPSFSPILLSPSVISLFQIYFYIFWSPVFLSPFVFSISLLSPAFLLFLHSPSVTCLFQINFYYFFALFSFLPFAIDIRHSSVLSSYPICPPSVPTHICHYCPVPVILFFIFLASFRITTSTPTTYQRIFTSHLLPITPPSPPNLRLISVTTVLFQSIISSPSFHITTSPATTYQRIFTSHTFLSHLRRHLISHASPFSSLQASAFQS